VVLALMMLVIGHITSGTSKIWRDTSGKIGTFQNARGAFDTMTQTLSQATLNTYYDYYDANGVRNTAGGSTSFTPSIYGRFSELHFLSGPASKLLSGVSRKDSSGTKAYPAVTSGHAVFFQAPIGYTQDTTARNLDNTLSAIGYFVEFGSDKDFMPPLVSEKITPKNRYRLVQMIQSSEKLSIYKESWSAHSAGTMAAWFKTPLELTVADPSNPRPTQVLADNVILMILRPKLSDQEFAALSNPVPIAPDYTYDSQPKEVIPPIQLSQYPSRYQLPPLIGVTLVAIDEASAIRLEAKYGATPPLAAMSLDNLFKATSDTNIRTDYDNDLKTLKTKLDSEKITYRIFETELALRSSKWSQN